MTADLDVERETYQQSRAGLNEMYLKAQGDLEKLTLEKKVTNLIVCDGVK